MAVKTGYTLIRVSKATNERLLAAREIMGKSISAMAEEAFYDYLQGPAMAERLIRDERRRKILLGKLSTP